MKNNYGHNCWTLCSDISTSQQEYLKSILEFLLVEFGRCFGKGTMCNEDCLVFNDPSAEYPMLIVNTRPIRIRLSQQDISYWAQTIYQLSHELTHYALRQHKQEKNFTLKWFEEMICEAMSLYLLRYSADHWSSCKLSKVNPEFSYSIEKYLSSELGKSGERWLRDCKCFTDLKHYENHLVYSRIGHLSERNTLYNEIITNPDDAICFLEYSKYIIEPEKLLVDFNQWKQNSDNSFLDILVSVAPPASLV